MLSNLTFLHGENSDTCMTDHTHFETLLKKNISPFDLNLTQVLQYMKFPTDFALRKIFILVVSISARWLEWSTFFFMLKSPFSSLSESSKGNLQHKVRSLASCHSREGQSINPFYLFLICLSTSGSSFLLLS